MLRAAELSASVELLSSQWWSLRQRLCIDGASVLLLDNAQLATTSTTLGTRPIAQELLYMQLLAR
jgi:hypothetical protein